MWKGYDPNKQPPYSQEVYFKLNGKVYRQTYYVCRGYGGSVSITSDGLEIVKSGQEDERSISKKSG